MEQKAEQQKTVLIVEDEKNIVDILRFNLQREGYRTVEAYDGADGLEKARSENPDIILLDVMLPKMIGFDVCRTLRDEGNNVPVIILTAREEEADKVLGLEIGADDYITKPFSMLLLGKRVAALLRRCGKSPELNQIQIGDITVDFGGYTASGQNGPIDLTPKEIDLLKLLVEHKGLVLTRSQILDELWGYDYPIIDRTIDTYIKNLRKKLGLDRIVTVKGVGYKYEEQL